LKAGDEIEIITPRQGGLRMGKRATHSAVIARLDRAIQYAATHRFIAAFPAYWIPAFAGMTRSFEETP
jgi:hypothetical protein